MRREFARGAPGLAHGTQAERWHQAAADHQALQRRQPVVVVVLAGANLAPRPLETMLAGTGGCTAYDVVLILKRGRHDVHGCSVQLKADRAETDPKVFTQIHMHFVVTGRGVPASAVERAIAMSHDKYCSASIMLAKTAQITTSFEVVEA